MEFISNSMKTFLEKSEEDQRLIEFRSNGLWEHREVGLHDGLLIVVSLDFYIAGWYPGVIFEAWYVEGPTSRQPLPLGFSSVEDYQMFTFDHPNFSYAQESVLHWLGDEVTCTSPIIFLNQIEDLTKS